MHERVHTSEVAPYKSHISQGLKAGRHLFLSGQTGLDPNTGSLKEGMREQTRQTIDNISAVLKAGGGKLDDIVSMTLFVTDMSQWDEYNTVWTEVFGDFETPPTRQSIEVKKLVGGALIEITTIAVLSS